MMKSRGVCFLIILECGIWFMHFIFWHSSQIIITSYCVRICFSWKFATKFSCHQPLVSNIVALNTHDVIQHICLTISYIRTADASFEAMRQVIGGLPLSPDIWLQIKNFVTSICVEVRKLKCSTKFHTLEVSSKNIRRTFSVISGK